MIDINNNNSDNNNDNDNEYQYYNNNSNNNSDNNNSDNNDYHVVLLRRPNVLVSLLSQASKLEPLLIHCGGPGSDASCVLHQGPGPKRGPWSNGWLEWQRVEVDGS